MKRKRRYWYRLYCGECPVCGKDKSHRERVYGRKPKKDSKRYVILNHGQTYDHCLERGG